MDWLEVLLHQLGAIAEHAGVQAARHAGWWCSSSLERSDSSSESSASPAKAWLKSSRGLRRAVAGAGGGPEVTVEKPSSSYMSIMVTLSPFSSTRTLLLQSRAMCPFFPHLKQGRSPFSLRASLRSEVW